MKNNEKKAVLSETVATVIEQIWADAEKKNIEIEVLGFDEYDQEGNVTVDVAEDDLFSILRNLIENAVKYCPEGSTVTIELESLAPFKMNIHDNGPGIPKEERERVFDPFYRVLGSGETGTGHRRCRANHGRTHGRLYPKTHRTGTQGHDRQGLPQT